VLEWDRLNGFLLLDDLGRQTMLDVIDPAQPDASRPLYDQAIDALIRWQLASRPGVLPPYDRALLERELALFPEWYIGRHRGVAIEGKLKERLERSFKLIVDSNLASPSVYVHRDFMPRNLMVSVAPTLGTVSSLPPEGALAALGRPGDDSGTTLGVLDFQDAVYGPITYDIASLMRDAFLSWDEEFVLDITIRYWTGGAQGRAAGRRGLRRLLPRGRVDGPAAPPEGRRHLRAPHAARRQAPVPGRHAALHRLHPRHRQPLHGADAAGARDRRGRRHSALTGFAYGRV
jgi:hypothetical protein